MSATCTPSSLRMGSGEHKNAQPRDAPIFTHCKANNAAINMWAPYFGWCVTPRNHTSGPEDGQGKTWHLMPRCSSLNQGKPFHQRVTRKVTRNMQRPSGWGSRS